MRHNDAQAEPIEGFDTSDLPGMGPEGLMTEPDRKQPAPPPRLCEAGPCVNYHRFAIQLDVEAPLASGIAPGGKLLAGDAERQPFHVKVHHYCYPTVGIETELGALPVLECNRWEPMSSVGRDTIEIARDRFLSTLEGKEYLDRLAKWKADRAAEAAAADDDEVVTWIAMNLRDGGEIAVAFMPTGTDMLGNAIIDADSARAFVTRGYLKETCGIGRFELTIRNPGAEPITLNLEIA